MENKPDKDYIEKIKKALENVRPFLQSDGGDIELIKVTDDFRIVVNLLGACGTCPTSIITLKMGVEKYLKQYFPEIKEVVNINEYQ
jgi:Fe-S cluster biogenesis protein NfuA